MLSVGFSDQQVKDDCNWHIQQDVDIIMLYKCLVVEENSCRAKGLPVFLLFFWMSLLASHIHIQALKVCKLKFFKWHSLFFLPKVTMTEANPLIM